MKKYDGEWDNIKEKDKEFDFEYICYKFVSNLGEGDLRSRSEVGGDRAEGFIDIFKIIDTDYFIKKGLYFED